MPRSKTPLAVRQRWAEQKRAQTEACLKSLKAHNAARSQSIHDRLAAEPDSAFGRIVTACKGTKLFDKGRGNYPTAIKRMCLYESEWIRRPEDWKCRTNNVDRQFSSLARHLFSKYDIPTFMDEAWFSGPVERADAGPYLGSGAEPNPVHQEWFIKVGQGENIRKQRDLPIPLTKRMAHEMMQAPSRLSIAHAMRWGQIIAMGGNARCASAILDTVIGRSFQNDEFWQSVIRFFIANPMLDTVHYGPIVDYINNQRFVGQGTVIVEGFPQNIPPPQPNFSMNGRNGDALVEQVERWHKALVKTRRHYQYWESCGIEGFELVEGAGRNCSIWKITELLNSVALHAEGRAMQHCVGSYTGSCVSKRSAIYSMTLTTSEGTERRLTLEVSPSSMAIVQFRGKRNEWATEMDRKIMARWAAKVNLRV